MENDEKEKQELFRKAEEFVVKLEKNRRDSLYETIYNRLRQFKDVGALGTERIANELADAILANFYVQPIGANDRVKFEKEKLEIRQALRINNVQAGFLINNGINPRNVTVLSPDETASFRQRWRKIYIGNRGAGVMLHKCAACDHGGVSGYEAYDWHIFSYKKTPAQRIIEDWDEQEENRKNFLKKLGVKESRLVLFWEECHYLALELPAQAAQQCVFKADMYVSPCSLEWTFVSTHENFCFYAVREEGERGRL